MSIYSDINTSKSEKFPLVTDIDAVWQSFENFMKTKPGERFFRPKLGCPLRKDLLFELEYEEAVFYALTSVIDALELWDPRIKIHESESNVNLDYDNKIVNLSIAFSIKGFSGNIVRRNFSL